MAAMAAHTMQGRARQRGIALPMVLWVALAVALLAAGIATTAERMVARQLGGDSLAAARALRDTGLSLGVMLAIHPDPARRLPADGSTITLTEPEGSVTLTLWDEAGKADLNLTPPDRLLAVARRILPVEDRTALAAALTARRRSSIPWHSVQELGAFLSPAGYARLHPLVTVHGPAMAGGLVDLRRMPAPLRAVWPGLDRLTDGPEGQGVGHGLGADAAALAALGLTASGPPGSVFTLRILARANGGAVASAEAVVWITVAGAGAGDQAYRILEWRDPAIDILIPTDSLLMEGDA